MAIEEEIKILRQDVAYIHVVLILFSGSQPLENESQNRLHFIPISIAW